MHEAGERWVGGYDREFNFSRVVTEAGMAALASLIVGRARSISRLPETRTWVQQRFPRAVVERFGVDRLTNILVERVWAVNASALSAIVKKVVERRGDSGRLSREQLVDEILKEVIVDFASNMLARIPSRLLELSKCTSKIRSFRGNQKDAPCRNGP